MFRTIIIETYQCHTVIILFKIRYFTLDIYNAHLRIHHRMEAKEIFISKFSNFLIEIFAMLFIPIVNSGAKMKRVLKIV